MNYWAKVRLLATEIVDKSKKKNDWYVLASEKVGSDYFIINYHMNEEVLNESRNTPDDDEVFAMSNSKNWKDLRCMAAHIAMERDVLEECDEILLERTEDQWYESYYNCPNCDYFWDEEWDCACDSECPNCGEGSISPYRYLLIE